MASYKRLGIFNTYTSLSTSPSTNDQVLPLNKNSSSNLNPAFCPKIFINELNPFSNKPYSLLLAKVLTSTSITQESTSTLIQDSQGSTVQMKVTGSIHLQSDCRIGVFDPMMSMVGRQIFLEAKANSIFVFDTDEEFLAVGWVDIKPPGFDCEHYLRMGDMMMELKRYEEALDKYTIGLKLDTSHIQLRNKVAEIYFSQKKYSEAIQHSSKAYEQNVNLDSALILADSYLMMNQITEAHKIFDEICKKHTGNKRIAELQKRLEIKVRKVKPYKIKLGKINRTKLSRLKELVLVEWPRLMSAERVKDRLGSLGVPVDRVTIKGKTAILFYDEVESRETAREKILELVESEFMLANEPLRYTHRLA